jgi:hypothetical protein
MVLGRILMSKSGFKDEVLIKLIVGVVKHVTFYELGPVDYRGSNRLLYIYLDYISINLRPLRNNT